jgi:hypothetical protein
VLSLVPYIELHGDKLWIVAHLRLKEPLSPPELLELKDWWTGQLSDGVGESWEQREIKVGRGDLYLVPWTSDDRFFIDTQREFSSGLGWKRLLRQLSMSRTFMMTPPPPPAGRADPQAGRQPHGLS